MDDEEFYLIIPSILKGLIISPFVAIIGYTILSWISSSPRRSIPAIINSLSSTIIFFGFISLCLGVIFSFGYFIMALISGDEIIQFYPIKKIVISNRGITLYRKDASVSQQIDWQQIKNIRFIYLKHMFLGVIEARREPTTIELNLVNGEKFRIPTHIILKEEDRIRMVSKISRYTIIIPSEA